jgi:hypothetical protein
VIDRFVELGKNRKTTAGYFEPHEQFFSYLVAVTINGDRAANLDL